MNVPWSRDATVRNRFRLLAVVALLVTAFVAVVAVEAVARAGRAHDDAVQIASIQRYHQDADAALEAMRAEVLSAFLLGDGVALRVETDIDAMLADLAADFEHDHVEIAALEPSEELRAALPEIDEEQAAFLEQSRSLAAQALDDPVRASEALPAYLEDSDHLFQEMGVITETLDAQRVEADNRASTAGSRSKWLIGVVAGLGLFSLLVLSRVLMTSMGRLIAHMNAQSENDRFRRRLTEAFEMADTGDAVDRVVADAMVEIDRDSPMELLQADSSLHHVRTAATSPTAGGPGCPVQSTGACVAARRGHQVVFETSEALNACPKLKERPDGPRSAACVPVTFNGRALGVLHATGPAHEPPSEATVEQMTALAAAAGARIGTITAFQGVRRRASTDGLTGLPNRQSFEDRARELLATGESFALVMVDLDHFKDLNDTYGHEVGDRALRMFGTVLVECSRESDLPARLGGEEFVIVAAGSTADSAVELVERVRACLAAKVQASGLPPFTSSFGIADSSMGDSVDDILRIADAGLLKAKTDGRDRLVVASPALEADRFDQGRPRGEQHLLDVPPPDPLPDRV